VAAEVPSDWPANPFVAVAVDADTGELVALDRSSGVSIGEAIASSICVPGIFPPVHVAGRRLVDGGVRTGTNADLAAGHDEVLVLAPIGSLTDGLDVPARQAAEAEVAGLRAAGARVTIVFPDDAANVVIGPNRMDAAIGPKVEAEGRRQGLTLAAELAGRWSPA
jgi:NTE family protein